MIDCSRHFVKAAIAILIIALAVRVAAAFWWQGRLPSDRSFAFGDSESYWQIARSVAAGRGFQYGEDGARVFRTPGYPLLLAPLFVFGGENPRVMAARGIGSFLGTVAVAGAMCLARVLFDDLAALISGAVLAVYPGAVACSVFVLSEAPYSPLVVWQIVFWALAWRCDAATSTDMSNGERTQSAFRLGKTVAVLSIAAGLLAGAATLVRPSHLLFTPFVVVVAMLGTGRIRNLKIGVMACLAMSVVMAPWWIRNYQVTGQFVATTLQMGASLYDGLGPTATGASDMSFVTRFHHEQLEADLRSPGQPGIFEARLDQRMKQAAVAWVQENPGKAIRLAGTKFLRMWSPLPNAVEFHSWVFRLVTLFSFTPLIIFSGIGLHRFAGRGFEFRLCVMPAIYLTCLHMVFVSSIRYREPAMIVMTVLAAAAIAATVRRLYSQDED